MDETSERYKKTLELSGRDLKSLVLNELLGAIDDVEMALVVNVADVAAVEETVGVNRRGRRRRVVQVA